MQSICRLSRRWHQQFCQSPSFGPHKQCLQTLVPYREYRQDRRIIKSQRQQPSTISDPTNFFDTRERNPIPPAQRLSKQDSGLVVREFEQHGSDKSTRRSIEPDKELKDETAEVWAELQEVEKQLEIAQQGPFGPQSPFMKQLPADQREALLKALSDEGGSAQDEEDVLDLAEIDRLMEEDRKTNNQQDDLSVTLAIPKSHQVLASHFNRALNDAQSAEDDMMKNLNLWKWYLRCQQKIPGFSRIISENVWKVLWESQSRLQGRQKHLVVLGQDMQAVGEILHHDQCLEFIRALYSCDDIAAALTAWEDMRPLFSPKASSDFVSNFYSTGTQLYAALGRPQKAETVALAAIRDGADPRLLVHVISGWAQTKTTKSATKAWAAYLRMRTLLGDDITPDLYDKISDVLLDTKRSDMALAVFKDMIAGVQGSGRNTLESYRQSLGRLEKDADAEELETAINQVSLTMLLAIPKQYQNKFFFASWIKKLLGQQRIEAASMVVDLMYERHIKPDAIHLNGIIGAWLRDRSAQSREKAEKLAWEMVQAKIDQVAASAQNVALRNLGNIFRTVMPLEEGENAHVKPIHLERPVPAANLETFSLLFHHYEERRKWKEFQRLTQTMIGPAQLKPNSFIMNKWLAAEVQARSFSRFWTLFNGLRGHVTPDVETFGLAWQVVAAQRSGSKEQGTIGHRRLFASMMTWMGSLKGRQVRSAKKDFAAGFYTEIMRCFCQQVDLAGSICAMQGLYATFEASPDDVSVRLLTGLVARLLPISESDRPAGGGRRRAQGRFSSDQTVLKSIADIIDTLEAEKKMELIRSEQGRAEELDDEDSTASRKLRADVLTEFLVVMMHKMKKTTDNSAKTVRDVAQVMQVDISHVNLKVHLS